MSLHHSVYNSKIVLLPFMPQNKFKLHETGNWKNLHVMTNEAESSLYLSAYAYIKFTKLKKRLEKRSTVGLF